MSLPTTSLAVAASRDGAPGQAASPLLALAPPPRLPPASRSILDLGSLRLLHPGAGTGFHRGCLDA
eukprot:5103992-Alexandrium_andersonii.AAC.1